MLKSKEFKALIGFDHSKIVFIFILISGLVFPYIFLGERIEEHLKNRMGAVIGIVYSSILTFGNIAIFYRFKTSHKTVSTDRKPKQILHEISVHIGFTLIVSTFMLLVPIRYFSAVPISLPEALRNMVGACLFVAIYIGFYEAAYYMNALNKSIKKQEQLKRENVESQLEILKNQIKPHFLFNSLNTLASLIPEDAELAVDYVQKLAKVYRYVLEIKDKKLIPIEEELNCIKAYLFMLQTRFGQNLQYEIKETGLQPKHHIVPLSLQLLVENAVKHNIISSKKPLLITITPIDNKLVVANNLQPKIQVAKSTGTGLENIKSRYKILTDLSVEVLKTNEQFKVELPIIEVQ